MPASRIPSFLYRRLSRWITCEFRAGDDQWMRMRSKYDVASFADVFCKPFYWQCFHLMSAPPKLVVDCGAHCGHFTLLAQQCIAARFPDAPPPKYLLIEPNPALLPTIRQNLADAGLLAHAEIVQALLGLDPGVEDATLWVNKRNFLVSSFERHAGAQPHRVPCARLMDLVDKHVGPAGAIDVLKVDIEGGEFGMMKTEPQVFERVRLLLMEAHGSPEMRAELSRGLAGRGLKSVTEPLRSSDFELLTLTREG
jgi:FkbM family methyltransferase